MNVLYSIICVELLQLFSGILFCHLVSSKLSIVTCPYYAIHNSYSRNRMGTGIIPFICYPTYRDNLAFSKIIRGYIS